ncbi:hypothetical protein HY484_04020 [Candidatus Woesearchaeota archaeon]|nr:hypothetical protein [Candidatus Woesearchaeota archaeon]
MKQHNVGLKITVFAVIVLIVVVSVVFILSDSESSVNNTQVFVEKLDVGDGLPVFFASKMRVALTDGEKGNLSVQLGVVRQRFGDVNGAVNNLKKSGVSSAELNELELFLSSIENTMREVGNEIGPPAESLDDKAESVEDATVKIIDFSERIKKYVGGSANDLKLSAVEFRKEIAIFVRMLTNARRIDPRFPEKREFQDVITSLRNNPINATNSSMS